MKNAIFEKSVVQIWGEDGRAWLRKLPFLTTALRKKWSLSIEDCPYPPSISYVASVSCADDKEAVLKIVCPHKEFFTGVDALKLFAGNRSVRLLKEDKKSGAILLEKIKPGDKLTSIQERDDEKATRIGAKLIKEIPVKIPKNAKFPTVEDWFRKEAFKKREKIKKLNKFPVAMIDRAQDILKELKSSKIALKLLHGDLHHDNILFDKKRGWLAIDPKGVIGDPAFDAARFLWNPYELRKRKNIEFLIEKRIKILSKETGFDAGRLAAWGYIDSINVACWSALGGGAMHRYNIQCAHIFDRILKKVSNKYSNE